MNQDNYNWLDDWKEQAKYLAELYQARRYQETKAIMAEQSDLFLDRLFRLNDQEWSKDKSLEEINLLTDKPINCHERLDYVKSNLEQYHAFIQLDALYDELAKLAAKLAILKQRKKSAE
ncbi:YpoC family protein [Amphibacillus sp. Q70]|uniref:YpoC family protein n=1 Tax=Amphibacillus sp. Q70 TaxID=3453416 RepID=UPI003F86200A